MGFAVAGVVAAGALAGSMGSHSSSTSEGSSSSSVGLRDATDVDKGRSSLEATGQATTESQFAELMRLVGQGPGSSEVTANTQFQNQYASQLQQLLGNISNPNQQQNYNTAKQYFAPQQTALDQQFTQANVDSNRLAARLGRSGNDPILRNKLMQEQTRQQTMLNSQVGAFGQQLPAFQANQLMGIGNQLSNLRQGLATQAMSNRQTLLGMGNQLATSERNYRLATANRTGASYNSGQGSSGGGLAGAINGGLAGFGAASGLMGTQASPVTPYTGTSYNGRMGNNVIP